MRTTATPYVKTSRPTKSGEYPIFIRFSRNSKDAYSRIADLRIKEKYWSKKKHRVTAKHPDYEWVNQRIAEEVARALKVIATSHAEGGNHSVHDLQDLFEGKRIAGSFFEYARVRLARKLAAASALNPTASPDTWIGQTSDIEQFKLFAKDTLTWRQFDTDLLRRWDEAMVQQGNRSGTRNKKLSTVRATVNEAVREGLIRPEDNPFLQFKMPPATNGKKRKLRKEELKALAELDLNPGSDECFARDVYCLSYLMRGARVRDVLSLKWGDFREGRWTYCPSKLRTKSPKTLSVTVSRLVEDILAHYGPLGPSDEYVFPRLRGMTGTAVEKTRLLRNERDCVGRLLKDLAKRVGIRDWEEVTPHTSRHSWAHNQLESGRDFAAISGGMGHSRQTTTEVYLKELDDSILDDQLDPLTQSWD